MGTVRPHDQTVRLVLRVALVVVVYDQAVDIVEVIVSGMGVLMEKTFSIETRKSGHHIVLEPLMYVSRT